MRGFFLRGGFGASPVSQLGIGVGSNEAVSAGTALGFFDVPNPIISSPQPYTMQKAMPTSSCKHRPNFAPQRKWIALRHLLCLPKSAICNCVNFHIAILKTRQLR